VTAHSGYRRCGLAALRHELADLTLRRSAHVHGHLTKRAAKAKKRRPSAGGRIEMKARHVFDLPFAEFARMLELIRRRRPAIAGCEAWAPGSARLPWRPRARSLYALLLVADRGKLRGLKAFAGLAASRMWVCEVGQLRGIQRSSLIAQSD